MSAFTPQGYENCKHDFKILAPMGVEGLQTQCKKCKWVYALRLKFEPNYLPTTMKIKLPFFKAKKKL